MYVFKTLILLLKSSNIRLKSSKISSTIKNDLIEFFLNRDVKCFIESSSIRVRTYVFLLVSVENQSAFSFNLFLIADNQSSIFEFLSSMRMNESNNFFDVTMLIVVITKAKTFILIDASRIDSTNTSNDFIFSFSSSRSRSSSSIRFFNLSYSISYLILSFIMTL